MHNYINLSNVGSLHTLVGACSIF